MFRRKICTDCLILVILRGRKNFAVGISAAKCYRPSISQPDSCYCSPVFVLSEVKRQRLESFVMTGSSSTMCCGLVTHTLRRRLTSIVVIDRRSRKTAGRPGTADAARRSPQPSRSVSLRPRETRRSLTLLHAAGRSFRHLKQHGCPVLPTCRAMPHAFRTITRTATC